MGKIVGGIIAVVVILALMMSIILAPLMMLLDEEEKAYSVNGTSVVQAALEISSQLKGELNNSYDLDNDLLKDTIDFWRNTICSGNFSGCGLAEPGKLQCVSFVRAVFERAGYSFSSPGNGNMWWGSSQALSALPKDEWKRIEVGKMPMPGDIISWTYGENGHVAVIVEVIEPDGDQDGKVIYAQANAPGDDYPNPLDKSKTLGVFNLTSKLQLTGGNQPSFVPGYIRPPSNVVGVDLPDTEYYGKGIVPESFYQTVPKSRWPYINKAISAAKKHGIDPYLFVRQIRQESGFNPDAKSPAGAIGIAQFMPGTAREWNVNPRDVDSALDGGARYMKKYRDKYFNKTYNGHTFNVVEAHGLALVAYNAGDGNAQRCARYGASWRQHINITQTIDYVRIIMG